MHDIVKEVRKSTSQEMGRGAGGGGGVINKIFYVVAPPRGLTTYLFITLVYKMVYKWVPCEQRFLSSMAFTVYEVVACQSRSWYVTSRGVNKPATRLTSDANDFVNARSHAREKPLLTG